MRASRSSEALSPVMTTRPSSRHTARELAASSRTLCLLEGRVVMTGDSGALDRDALVAAYFGSPAAPPGTAATDPPDPSRPTPPAPPAPPAVRT